MRITAFIGAAVLALCSLAFVPLAMALDDPPPEICVPDLSAPVSLDNAVTSADATCAAFGLVADVRVDPASTSGANGVAAQTICSTPLPASIATSAYRHEDPGRCLV